MNFEALKLTSSGPNAPSIRTAGFTLIEVLVATTILLATIAVVANIYLTSLSSISKVSHHIVMNRVVPSLVDGIQLSVREGAKAGKTLLSNEGVEWDVEYRWDAVVLESSSAPQYFSDVERRWVRSARQYQLWRVSLTLRRGETTKEFVYREFAWGPG